MGPCAWKSAAQQLWNPRLQRLHPRCPEACQHINESTDAVLAVIYSNERHTSKYYGSISFHKCIDTYNPHFNQDRTFVSP